MLFLSVELETQLEQQLVDELTGMDYEQVYLKNAKEVEANFLTMLNKHNAATLGEPITGTEFGRFLKHISGKSVFESSEILRSKHIIERDNGDKVYVELFNTQEWCSNQFQVAHQIQDEGAYKGRYDVTLFVNGLPLVQIELKRRGIDYKEAFNQISRYKLHNFGGLFGFVQVFVVSNGATTKYFANKDGRLDFEQTFYWTDKENERITNLHDFTQAFLRPCHVAKLISRFMILNKSTKSLMVMRPYQTYAVEAIVEQAVNTRNNGYVWHTTGSGKTLTSFKASQILAEEPSIDVVFFLVDRMDLDTQTNAEFNKFHPDSVDTTDKTSTLVKQIKSGAKLVVTTIQKMNRAVTTERYKSAMCDVKDKRVVFIIDECHRTQFGAMHNNVKAHFTYAQYFGFTGTPIFAVNKSQDGRTTADIFGKPLHSYLIKHAIHDGNVLGFSVKYHDTFKKKDDIAEEYVSSIDTQEAYNSPLRVQRITEHILKHHNQLTQNTKTTGYTAMFATSSIASLTQYYDAFAAETHELKIAAVFSYTDNEDMDGHTDVSHSKDTMARMMVDYNTMFNTNYTLESYAAYQTNVSERVKAAQIDILIVVNKFLTGFDSKMLNTLYVDKPLENHGLIQAFSRTNRVVGSSKPFGNIICYRPLKDRVDAAICLYSDVDLADEVLMWSYDAYLTYFEKSVDELREVAATPATVDTLFDEEDQKEFVRAFREVAKLARKLENFTEFDRDASFRDAGFTPNEFADYQAKFLDMYRGRQKNPKASILGDIDFEIELFATDKINVSYILRYLSTLDFTDAGEVEKFERALSQATDGRLILKAELIRAFIKDVLPNLDSPLEVEDAFGAYIEQQRVNELEAFASTHHITVEHLLVFIAERDFFGHVRMESITNSLKDVIELNFMTRIQVINDIKSFVETYTEKYA